MILEPHSFWVKISQTGLPKSFFLNQHHISFFSRFVDRAKSIMFSTVNLIRRYLISFLNFSILSVNERYYAYSLFQQREQLHINS